MANLQLKEKLKKVMETTESGKYVPDKAKSVGMCFFYLFFAITIVVLLFFVIGMFQQNHYVAASFLAIISIGCLLFLWKVIRADSLENKN
ncbi:hypothetical protein [Rummeliibacillus pycnus]|uniref:hypothetical protein n=1 Tax=Rummeliibacillus pycnus TaxID=101070 RepID=UPI0037CBB493